MDFRESTDIIWRVSATHEDYVYMIFFFICA